MDLEEDLAALLGLKVYLVTKPALRGNREPNSSRGSFRLKTERETDLAPGLRAPELIQKRSGEQGGDLQGSDLEGFLRLLRSQSTF
jgi:hypothetical protein